MYETFRPRKTATVAIIVSVLLLAWEALLFWIIFFDDEGVPFDATVLAFIGLGGLWLIYRHASVRADVNQNGIAIRNLLRKRYLQWPQILQVRLGERSWVQLDLADGSTVAVMAIQRADGEHGQQEARRLATLVQKHGTAHEE